MPPGEQAASYGERLREGWDFLRHDPVLMSLCVMVAVTNLLDLAWSAVLLPVWAHDTGAGVGGDRPGLRGLGRGLDARVGGRRGLRHPPAAVPDVRRGVPVTGLAPVRAVRPRRAAVDGASCTCLVGGCASGFLNPVLGAVQFERIPRAMVGRVTSLSNALCWSLMPLGGILGGLLVSGLGLTTALVVVGLAYFVTTMAPAVLPRSGRWTARGSPGPSASWSEEGAAWSQPQPRQGT